MEYIIYLIHLNSDTFTYAKITKLISANLQDGHKGTLEKLRYTRVIIDFTFHFPMTKDFFLYPEQTFEL